MIYALMGYLHATVVGRLRRVQRLAAGEAGQGTVEYVGLILLVSLLMVGMVAAMKGFNRNRNKTRNLESRSDALHGRWSQEKFTPFRISRTSLRRQTKPPPRNALFESDAH